MLAFCGLNALALGQVLENYDQKWQAYSGGNWWERNDQIQVKVNVRDFEESFLKLQIPSKSTLFINGKLWEYFRSDTLEWIPLRDIQAIAESDSATFILINPDLGNSKVSIQKVISPGFESLGVSLAEDDSPFCHELRLNLQRIFTW